MTRPEQLRSGGSLCLDEQRWIAKSSRRAPSGGADSVRPLQLAHLKLYLENAIELEAH